MRVVVVFFSFFFLSQYINKNQTLWPPVAFSGAITWWRMFEKPRGVDLVVKKANGRSYVLMTSNNTSDVTSN